MLCNFFSTVSLPSFLVFSSHPNLTLTMLRLWMGAGVGVHVKIHRVKSAQNITPISRKQSRPRERTVTTETITTTTVLCLLPPPLPSARCCSLSSQSCWLWSGPCSLPAQLRLLPLCYICLNEPLSGEWRERESVTEYRMGGRRERSSFHIVVLDRERVRERYGWRRLWQCWMFPLWSILHSQHIFFSSPRELCNISLENINMPAESRNSYGTAVWMVTMVGLTGLCWLGMVFTLISFHAA